MSEGNTGHGPGYRYHHKVGPVGGLRAAMAFFYVIGFIAWLFGFGR